MDDPCDAWPIYFDEKEMVDMLVDALSSFFGRHALAEHTGWR